MGPIELVALVIVAVLAIVGLVTIARWLRRTPVVGGSVESAKAGPTVELSSTGGRPTTLRIEKKIVLRNVALKGQPGHTSLSVDGQTFARIDDIPDPKLRDEMRALLAGMPAVLDDAQLRDNPKLRERVAQELADVGIAPEPDGNEGATPPPA